MKRNWLLEHNDIQDLRLPENTTGKVYQRIWQLADELAY